MNRLIILSVIFLCISKLLTAQGQEGSISGTVVDGGDQKIIDAATISLFKAKDSSLVKINLADKAGNFLFEHIPFGKYYLLATSTGHLQIYSPLLEVNNNSTLNACTLQLTNNAKTLTTVNV